MLFAIIWAMAVMGIWQAMRRSADRILAGPAPDHGMAGRRGAVPLSEALGPVGMGWLAGGRILYTMASCSM